MLLFTANGSTLAGNYTVLTPMASTNVPGAPLPLINCSGLTLSVNSATPSVPYLLVPTLTPNPAFSLGLPVANLSASYPISSLAQLNADLGRLAYQQSTFIPPAFYGKSAALFTVSVVLLTSNGTEAAVTSVVVEVAVVEAPVSVFWLDQSATTGTVAEVTAGQTGPLGGGYRLTSPYVEAFSGADSLSATLSPEVGALSPAVFSGSVDAINAAVAAAVYTAPSLSAPSATYAAGDAHCIGALWNVSVVLIEANVTDVIGRSFLWVVPVFVLLVNQPPAITVGNPSAFAYVTVAYPSSTPSPIPLQQLGLFFSDVDSFGAAELVTVTSARGATLCLTANTTQCSNPTLSITAPLAELNDNSASWTYLPTFALTTLLNVTDTLTVSINDLGHSGASALTASVAFTVYLVAQPAGPSVVIAPVSVVQVNTTALSVTWPAYAETSAGSPPITFYLVTYQAVSGDVLTINVTATAALSYTVVLAGLNPATLYYVAVAAGNAYGASVPSSVPARNLTVSYPISSTACGNAQYCGAQWTLPVAPGAPTISVASDVGLSTVTITPSSSSPVLCDSFTITYRLVTNGVAGVSSSQIVSGNGSASVSTAIVGLALRSTYLLQVVGSSSLFGVASAATSYTLITLAAPPTIAAFTVSDPNNTATAATFNAYRAGLALTLTFSAPVVLGGGNSTVPRSLFTFSGPVGDLSAFTQTSPTTLTATVLTVGPTAAASVHLGVLAVTPLAAAQVTAVSPPSYPVESASPKLSGSFGTFDFGSTALSVSALPTTTNASAVSLSTLVTFAGSASDYSYNLSVVNPASAVLTTSTSLIPLTTYSYGTAGGTLADVAASIAALVFNVPAYFAGQAAYRVDALTWLNGSFVVTGTAIGQVTVPPVYHAPAIVVGGSGSVVVNVTSSSQSLTALFPGLGLYDVDADPIVNPFADTSATYTLTVAYSTAAPSSYLAFGPYAPVTNVTGMPITVPGWSTLTSLQSTAGGFSGFTAYWSLPGLSLMLNALVITTFAFDPTLTPSVISLTLVSPQGQSASVNLTVTQNVASVPAASPTGAYLMPNMQSFLLVLDSQVTTPLATSGVKFSPALLFGDTTAFGSGAACQYPASNPLSAYLTSSRMAATASAIQCSFGTGAEFALDPNNSAQLTPPLSLIGNAVLQRAPGGLTFNSVGSGNVQLLSEASAYGSPSFALSGSTSLSYCDNQTLSITAIVAPQGVGLGTSYSWTVNDAAINAALVRANLTTGGALVVPHVELYIARGSSYVLNLTVTNLVGRSSSQSLTITRASGPAPLLLGPSTQTNAISDLILLSFTPQLPGSCFSATSAILYSWAAANSTVVMDPATTATSTLGFARPYLTHGLQYGQSYTFVLTAQLAGLTSSSVNRSVTLTVVDLPLVTAIAGPSLFQAGAGSPIALTTVGATQLPTQARQVVYVWTCTTAAGKPCVAADGVTQVPVVASQSSVSVAANTLPASTAPYSFAVVVSVDGAAPQTASVQVYLVAGTPVAINVTATRGATLAVGSVIVNDFDKLTLTATSSAASNATYTWSCVSCPQAFALNRNVSSSSALVLNPSSTAGYWTPLATYQFRVDVVPGADASSASFSSVAVTVNTPPTAPATEALTVIGPSGVLGASVAGYANGIDKWTLTVAQQATQQSGWTGTGTLSYQFFFIDSIGAVNVLSSASTATSVTTSLPLGWGVNGSLPVGVYVYDSLGGQSSVVSSNGTWPMVRLQAAVSASQLLSGLLNASANLSPSAFCSAVVSLASAATTVGGAATGATGTADAVAALTQRVQLLNLLSANIASVSPSLGLQAVGSVVGGGAVTNPAALSQAAGLVSSLLTEALSDPLFSSTPLQLSSFFHVLSGVMASNGQSTPAPSPPHRRLLSVASYPTTAALTTQATATAVFSQALRAISSNFLGAVAAPASEIVPPTTAAPAVYRAGVTQGVVAPLTVTLSGTTATLTAGASWLQSNALSPPTTAALDIQIGLIAPDPYVASLNATNGTAFAGYTVFFDVVDTVNGTSQSSFTWVNTTGAPALTFNTNDSVAIAALSSLLSYQCLEWSRLYNDFIPIGTSGPSGTSLTCYPATPGSYVSYSASTVGLATAVQASSSSGGSFSLSAYANLFSGYNGAHSDAGYYVAMAISIALCLLFPVFALTYKPTRTEPVKGMPPQSAAARSADREQGAYASGLEAGGALPDRPSTDAGSMAYADVRKLKKNVYATEEKVQEDDEKDRGVPVSEGDLGFIVHQ